MNKKLIAGWAVRILLIALILCWMITIYGFSSADGVESSSLSDKITIRVVYLLKSNYESLVVEQQEAFFSKLVLLLEK